MKLHYRHKNRLLTTIFTAIALLLCFNIYFILVQFMTLEMSLILTFATGILVLTLYHLYVYEHCHEHITMINNLTQVYFGVVLLVSLFAMLLLRWVFGVDLVTSYIVLSLLVIGTIFLTLGPYDRFLESHIGGRFPMDAPQPTHHHTTKKKAVLRK